MHRVQLIHWKKKEAKEKVVALRAAGYRVSYGNVHGTDMMRGIRTKPPAAVVIDLSRMPSQGRDLALWLRSTKATRRVPLVFVDGDTEKVARIRKVLPDAAYTSWNRVHSALKQALARPPAEPVKPVPKDASDAETPEDAA